MSMKSVYFFGELNLFFQRKTYAGDAFYFAAKAKTLRPGRREARTP